MTVAYVIDATCVAEYLVAGAYTLQARELISKLDQDFELWTPEFCLLECANVLWKRVRFKQASDQDARLLIVELGELPFSIIEARELLPRAFEIGVAQGLAIYDSLYLSLAEALKIDLITLDKKQANAAELLGISLKPITDFTPQLS